jgi:hypothetical protein
MFGIGFLVSSNCWPRLSDGLENALSGRVKQNSEDHKICAEKREKRRNTHKEQKFADEIKPSEKYPCRDAHHPNREQRNRSTRSACPCSVCWDLILHFHWTLLEARLKEEGDSRSPAAWGMIGRNRPTLEAELNTGLVP